MDDDRPDDRSPAQGAEPPVAPHRRAPSARGRRWSTARGLATLGVVVASVAVVLGVRTAREDATLPRTPPPGPAALGDPSVAAGAGSPEASSEVPTTAAPPTAAQDERLRVAFATNVGADFARGYDRFGPALLASCRMMRQDTPPAVGEQEAQTARRFEAVGASLTGDQAGLVLEIMRGEYCPIDG